MIHFQEFADLVSNLPTDDPNILGLTQAVIGHTHVWSIPEKIVDREIFLNQTLHSFACHNVIPRGAKGWCQVLGVIIPGRANTMEGLCDLIKIASKPYELRTRHLRGNISQNMVSLYDAPLYSPGMTTDGKLLDHFIFSTTLTYCIA